MIRSRVAVVITASIVAMLLAALVSAAPLVDSRPSQAAACDRACADVTAQLAPERPAARPPAAAARPDRRVAPGGKGLAADLLSLSPDALAAALDDLVRLGVTYARMDFDWAEIQPLDRAQFDTTRQDRVVRAARDKGIRILGIIDYTPEWANGGAGTKLTPPLRAEEFGAFAGFLARRYAAMGVHEWEIWNEPNLGSIFWRTGADPVRYVELLKAAATAIRAVDPQAFVITAGLSPAADQGLDMSPQKYLEGIYAAGGRDFFDAVGDHPYTFPALPSATDGSAYWWTAMLTLRDIMVKNGDAGKAIWITEFGAPTPGGAADEERQAAILADAFRLWSRHDWAGPFIVYCHKDAGTDRSNPEDFFGLLRADGTRKPSWGVFRDAPR